MFWGIPCPVLILKSSEAILLYCNIVLSFALVNGMKFVIIKATNGLIDKLLFLDGQRVVIKDKQYAVDRNEYNRLIDFIYALKIERLIIGNDEITFNPSEWARSDVDNAVNEGLVPKLNQINYIGKITRLEVCQLIDNLLNKQGID